MAALLDRGTDPHSYLLQSHTPPFEALTVINVSEMDVSPLKNVDDSDHRYLVLLLAIHSVTFHRCLSSTIVN